MRDYIRRVPGRVVEVASAKLAPRFAWLPKLPPVPQKSVRTLKRHWLTVAFFLGFLVDNITLNRVDQLFDNLILATYVLLAMVSLWLLYAGAAGKLGEWLPSNYEYYIKRYAPLIVQFSFGGLLSGMLIFYARSGSWGDSWPFLLIILAVIIGNETIRDRAKKLLFNILVLFVALFSYVVLVVPVLTGMMGDWVFVGSGVLTLIVMYGYVELLRKIVPKFIALHTRLLVFSIGMAFVSLNGLYFLNIIPPIPLSLKDIGIYHDVTRTAAGYRLVHEDGRWFEPFKNQDDTFHPVASDQVHCFASVFAPTRLATEIFHRWEFKDSDGDWQTASRISYAIEGGRGDGFRGYTRINSFADGKWRCTVETARGQVLGREVFWIDSTEAPRELVSRVE